MELKAARCPSCSGEISLDPSKEKGFCMHCGSEIIVDDAIQKVKIDHKDQLENYLKIVKKAFNDQRYQEGYDYCNKIIEIDYDTWEAHYYKGLCAAYIPQNPHEIIDPKFKDIIKGSDTALNMLSPTVNGNELNKYKIRFAQDFLNRITTADKRFETSGIHSDHIIPACDYCLNLVEEQVADNVQEAIDLKIAILYRCHDSLKKHLLPTHDVYVHVPEELLQKLDYPPDKALQKLNYYAEEYNKYNPDKPLSLQTKKTKGACYIATAVYGDYNMPQVVTLRQYRDEVLLNSNLGRLFVKIYYICSPPIAELLRSKTMINKCVRNALNYIVDRIEQQKNRQK